MRETEQGKGDKAMTKEEFDKIWDFAEEHGLMKVPLDRVIKRYQQWKRKQART